MARALAIFDVDGTLVPKPSTEVRFVAWLLRRGCLSPGRLLRYLANVPGRVLRDGWLGLKTNKAHLAGLDSAELAALAETFLGEAGQGLWNPAVRDRLEEHRRRGDAVLLLTGTPDFLANALARRLGVDGWQASVLPRSAGRISGDPLLQHPHGPDKLRIARRMADQAGGALGDAWAYGDAWGDRHLLGAVGHPVVVRGGGRLLRLARERAWEVLATA